MRDGKYPKKIENMSNDNRLNENMNKNLFQTKRKKIRNKIQIKKEKNKRATNILKNQISSH